jgi:hypothetical protein
LSLAKVTIAKMFRKIRRYELCSGVAAHYVKSIVVCKLCVVQNLHLHLYQDARCNDKNLIWFAGYENGNYLKFHEKEIHILLQGAYFTHFHLLNLKNPTEL